MSERCTFGEEPQGCAIHRRGQPLGCITFMPFSRDDRSCDQDEEAFDEAFDEIAALNDAVYGAGGWSGWPIPVGVRAALRAERRT